MEFNLLQPKLNCNFSNFKFEYKVSTPQKKKMDTINMVKNNLKKKNFDSVCKALTLMWRLVRGNVLEFLGMFKDSHVWLQITPGNQMPRESEFLP